MARKKATDKPVTQRTQSQTVPIPSSAPFFGANTITLSTDMSVIYLIDNGRAIPFSLDTIGGVLIGEVGGQITIVSSMEPFPGGGKDVQTFALEARAVGIPVVKSAKIPTNRGTWNFLYLRERKQVCIIGAVDIDVSIQEAQSLEAQAFLFDLREGFVNIQKIGNTIVLESISVSI